MVLKLMAWVAIAFGVIAAVGAAALGAAIPLPFLVLALACAALLIFTGFSFMRGGTSAPAGLSAAWGFACATTYGFGAGSAARVCLRWLGAGSCRVR